MTGVFRGVLRAPVQPWQPESLDAPTVRTWSVPLSVPLGDEPGRHNADRGGVVFVQAAVIIAREATR